MYVDGVLRGSLQAPRAYFHVDGGDPMNIKSDIVLCGRADHAPGRTFDGKIAQLAFFDDALSAYQACSVPSRIIARDLAKVISEAHSVSGRTCDGKITQLAFFNDALVGRALYDRLAASQALSMQVWPHSSMARLTLKPAIGGHGPSGRPHWITTPHLDRGMQMYASTTCSLPAVYPGRMAVLQCSTRPMETLVSEPH